MSRILVLGAGMLLLGGCITTSAPTFTQHYALAAITAPSARKVTTQPATDRTLRIARIAAPPWLEGTALHYRLAYRHDQRIAAYAHSAWVAPPAKMLESMLQQALASGGYWRAVVGPASTAKADVGLRVRVNDFSQVFTGPGASYGQLDATATLTGEHGGKVIAQQRFRIRAKAPSADAIGGVKALSAASRQFATRLQRWLHATAEHAGSDAPHS